LGLRLPVPFLRKSNFKKLYTPYFMRDVKLCFSSGTKRNYPGVSKLTYFKTLLLVFNV